METMISKLTGGVRFETGIRAHTLVVDGPANLGGKDDGPNPPELVVAALGTCVGVYAVMFCNKHQISTEGMTIETSWEKAADSPSRIGAIHVKVELPAGVPEDKYEAFMKTVNQCMVHNTLHMAPSVQIGLKEPVVVGDGGCCSCQ
jgi:uncharacterized OsmC-like protein